MKTQTFKLAKNVVIMIVLLMNMSCNTETQKGDSKSRTAKAPNIDIHTAVVSENYDALKQHIAAGANLNEKDPYGGSSPLISAAVFGKTQAAKILLDAGADIDFQNNDGSTALHTAAFFCRPEIVKMLLDKGADKTIKNKYNATAYASVIAPYAEVKSTYEMMDKMLGPMGLKLDYAYIEKTRPEIATMLK